MILQAPSTLVAVLLNPPATTSGNRTLHAVERARAVLGHESVTVVNLCRVSTSSVVDLNVTNPGDGWRDARPAIESALDGAAAVLGAWGVAGLTGAARTARDTQVEWLVAKVGLVGLTSIWTVGGKPRHPSRWHQYASDKYQRTSGGSFEERLVQVLVETPLNEVPIARLGS